MESKIKHRTPMGTKLRLCLLMLIALISFNLTAQITINEQNKSIKEILKTIETRSNYRFFYNEELKGLEKVSSLNVNNVSIDEGIASINRDCLQS